MKFPKEMNDNGSNFRESNQKASTSGESKTTEENKECPAAKSEEHDSSAFVIEPNTTALIPPWLRNSLGLTEKGGKTNQKYLKTLIPTAGEKAIAAEIAEMKTDPDESSLKESSANPIIEVNIRHEADFAEDGCETGGKVTPLWKKNGKNSQYECNIFGLSKEKRLVRAVKSEVTSVDVVVPVEDQDDGKRKLRSRKTRNRTCKRIFGGTPKREEPLKEEQEVPSRPVSFSNTSAPVPTDVDRLNSKLLLLCGKSTVDSLTEEDVSLIQEMKNQLCHKEGFAKLFNEIKEAKNLDKTIKESKAEKPAKTEEREVVGEKFKREIGKDVGFVSRVENGNTKMVNNFIKRNSKMMEEERRYLEEIKRHYEKKKWNQKKISEEPEPEKPRPQHRNKDFMDKERKNKLRNESDLLAIEKAVNETLKKFIEMYRFQVPPEIVSSMKTNIVQSLQSENHDSSIPRKNLDALFREQLHDTNAKKKLVHTLSTGEGETKTANTVPERVHTFAGDENEVSKDVSEEKVKVPHKRIVKAEVVEEKDPMDPEDLRGLHKDFQECLNMIRGQLDIAGTKLCSVVLEKTDVADALERKLRIIHDFPRGVTECIKMCHEKLELGSPEGDNVRNSINVCDCRRTSSWDNSKSTCNQSCQTKDRTFTKSATQTEWEDIPVRDDKHSDLTPGLYRIIKAQTEVGRFYLCPEELDEESETVPRENFEGCENMEPEPYPTYPTYPTYSLPDALKSFSRETFRSERLPKSTGKLHRAFNSDCLGLNTWEVARRESKRTLMNFFTDGLANSKVRGDNETKGKRNDDGLVLRQNSELSDDKEKHADNSENYHMGCVWLWNGKKMYPGVDLKVHVEDLLREKLREILGEVKLDENGTGCKENPSSLLPPALSKRVLSGHNLDLRKTHSKFRIETIHHAELATSDDSKPFIFSGSGTRGEEIIPAKDVITISRSYSKLPFEPKIGTNFLNQNMRIASCAQEIDRNQSECESTFGRSVREVGTQNSQHTITSLNISRLKPKSKVCQAGKPIRQKCKMQAIVHKGRRGKARTVKPFSFAENVGEAKKVKLEFRESKREVTSKIDKVSNTESVRECFSVISNDSSSSTIGPVRVKLIGIEVSKEKKNPSSDIGAFETERKDGQEPTRVTIDEYQPKDMDIYPRDQLKRHKHWELIENVLNRVNQKEKDSLWNDIRDFVKKKIGRDINDEGAREVCIEIEQDLPRLAKGMRHLA
ncbi:UNVERIFIED_CONTAM: hypothetical protein PYX00_007875 [Menopon gallinae]|uniref:Uncharacterized protein n=1 Tax=Menopon gallinae TaxID=328185 RepID=A0AAW2HKJ0_9NEOP